jgi:hypothetical protein
MILLKSQRPLYKWALVIVISIIYFTSSIHLYTFISIIPCEFYLSLGLRNIFLMEDDYFFISSRKKSGSPQLTSTFRRKFFEKVRNAISYYYSVEK